MKYLFTILTLFSLTSCVSYTQLFQTSSILKTDKKNRFVFENDTIVIQESTSSKDIKMWDSLMHLELISEIESEFKIEFSFNEVMSFNNVGDMLKVIEKKLLNEL